MIASVRGRILGAHRGSIILDTSAERGGIAYSIIVPALTLASAKEGEELTLYTYLSVRETAHELFGFETKDEREWFELLLSVSGVGPRSALGVLNAIDPRGLSVAIENGDAGSLSRAYGIGKKTAEKIVLELKDKVAIGTERRAGPVNDVIDALVGLGYSLKEARDASMSVPTTIEKTEDKIREAIRIASRA
ncbi:MAG: Holliday junction branch migration protein RuvA [Patescibacteria group bacterium]